MSAMQERPRRLAGARPRPAPLGGLASVAKRDDIARPRGQEATAQRRLGAKTADMQRTNDRELREQLTKLRTEHRLLDEEIVGLETSGTADQLHIKRLKKKKLTLKDQITAIEDQLLPDIIA